MVAMPLRRFSSAARNTSYLERVTPGPNTATGQPPAGSGRAAVTRGAAHEPHRAEPAGSTGGAARPPRDRAVGPDPLRRPERPSATVPALADAGELSKTVSSTNGSLVPTARSLNRRGRAMSAAAYTLRAADDEVESALARRDPGGDVGLPTVELAHHLTELTGGRHRGEGRPARLAVHPVGHHDLVAGGLTELRRRLAVQRRAGHDDAGEADAPADRRVADPVHVHGRPRDPPDVDRGSEADRDAGVEVEAVQLVDQPDLVAVGGRAVQSGIGSASRRPVTWVPSATVERSDGLITSGASAAGSQATNPAVTSSAVNEHLPAVTHDATCTQGAMGSVRDEPREGAVLGPRRSEHPTHGRHVDRTVDVGVAAGRVVEQAGAATASRSISSAVRARIVAEMRVRRHQQVVEAVRAVHETLAREASGR